MKVKKIKKMKLMKFVKMWLKTENVALDKQKASQAVRIFAENQDGFLRLFKSEGVNGKIGVVSEFVERIDC